MLRRNREIVIFNLSAIDLFCSGMGAVMVLMVLLMPYYRKTDPAKHSELQSPVAVVTPSAPPIPELPKSTPEPGIQIRAIDVVFVMDATMSMDEELAEVRSGMESIVQVLRRLSDHLRVGFVAYTDRDVQRATALMDVGRTPAGEVNLRKLLNVISQVELIGNEDWPEDVFAGLSKAESLDWREATKDRRQLIILIGDARTHPEDGQKSLQLIRTWAGSFKQSRAVHAVFTEPFDLATQQGFTEEINASKAFFKGIAAAGNGQYHSGQGDLLGSILDILIVR